MPPLPSLGDILRLHNLRSKKQLSQHFLLDPRSLAKVVRSAGPLLDASVVEVGPGPGGITRELFRQGAARVAAVELDARFLPGLQLLHDAVEQQGRRLDVFNQNALNFGMADLFPDSAVQRWDAVDAPNVHLVGNLPFHVAMPLLFQWLHDMSERRGLWRYGRVPITACFQAEVALRICAPPGDRERSRLSVMVQSLCEASLCAELQGAAFVPRARVDTVVVHLRPRRAALATPYPLLERLTRQLFAVRRKNLLYGLERLLPATRPDLVLRLVCAARVPPDRVAQDLRQLEWDALFVAYRELVAREPHVADGSASAASSTQLRNSGRRARKAHQLAALRGRTLSVALAHEALRNGVDSVLGPAPSLDDCDVDVDDAEDEDEDERNEDDNKDV